ncbi:phage portal protein [Gaopeijia maritima]|uniref:phage portal protein n=1 Tax=Gaopeijia maritima TaxID=3119007 RepID=UPI003285DD12
MRRHLPAVMTAVDWVSGRLGRGTRLAIGALAHAGAQLGRLTMDWVLAPLTSADQEVRSDLRTLRRRSRELCRNNSYAARFLGLLGENVVGPQGIRLQARIETGIDQFDADINRRIEDAWKRWSLPANASVDGKLSWRDLQKLVIQGVAQDGEALVRIIEGYADSEFRFALQLLDPDQLDLNFDRPRTERSNEVRMGVEVNEWGRPVAYHIFESHPQDYQTSRGQQRRIRVPASQMIHLFTTRRPGQTRGVPWLAPVMMDMRMLGGLQEAELVASRISAAKGGFFTKTAESALDPKSIRGSKRQLKMTVEPGVFDQLPEGWDFKAWDPQHPNSAFEAFNTVILRSIATGLRSSYSSLTGDLTKVSYSSIRTGALQDRDVYRDLQDWLSTHLHARVRSRWMVWAITSGQLQLPTSNAAEWDAHTWMPRGWEWVDPLKEMLAAELAFELRIDSRTRVAAERGRDYEEVVHDEKRERRIAEAAGLAFDPARDGARGERSALREDDEEGRAAVATALARRMSRTPATTGRTNGHHP